MDYYVYVIDILTLILERIVLEEMFKKVHDFFGPNLCSGLQEVGMAVSVYYNYNVKKLRIL